jgi:hypothetical protein
MSQSSSDHLVRYAAEVRKGIAAADAGQTLTHGEVALDRPSHPDGGCCPHPSDMENDTGESWNGPRA